MQNDVVHPDGHFARVSQSADVAMPLLISTLETGEVPPQGQH